MDERVKNIENEQNSHRESAKTKPPNRNITSFYFNSFHSNSFHLVTALPAHILQKSCDNSSFPLYNEGPRGKRGLNEGCLVFWGFWYLRNMKSIARRFSFLPNEE